MVVLVVFTVDVPTFDATSSNASIGSTSSAFLSATAARSPTAMLSSSFYLSAEELVPHKLQHVGRRDIAFIRSRACNGGEKPTRLLMHMSVIPMNASQVVDNAWGDVLAFASEACLGSA